MSCAGVLRGHQVNVDWMGEQVLTLADLLPDEPRAVLVGINPAPVSVAAGHYYQGSLGQRIFARLRSAGLLSSSDGYEDDAAVANGVGFTDIVKRPTRSAAEVRPDEYRYGRKRLADLLNAAGADLVVFTFKKSAEAYFGKFQGGGFVPGLRVGPAQVFVLPGPMEAKATADRKIQALREHLAGP